jgi:hypothetical protein
MPKELSQEERRRMGFPRDQHGRKWEAVYDIIANAPCSALIPHRWSAPWLPPDAYFVFSSDPARDREVVIDYDRLVRDRQAARAEYDRALKAEARKHGPSAHAMLEAHTLPDGRKSPHPLLLEEVGPPPLSDVFARAARAGNKWVLGLRRPDGSAYPVTPWAEPHLHELDDPYANTVDAEADDAADAFPDVEGDDAWAGSAESREFADADAVADLEEQFDAAAVGGSTPPVRKRGGRPRAA